MRAELLDRVEIGKRLVEEPLGYDHERRFEQHYPWTTFASSFSRPPLLLRSTLHPAQSRSGVGSA